MSKLNFDKYILVLFVLVIFLAVELFWVLPFEIKNITDINKKITQVKRDIEIIEKDWPHRDNYLKHSEKIKAEINAIYEKFVVPQQESSLFSFISSESKNFGIDIKVLKPMEVEDYVSTKFGKFKYLPISIKLQSQFHNLAKFLDSLQSGKHFFEIKELKIKSNYPYHDTDIIICGLVKE